MVPYYNYNLGLDSVKPKYCIEFIVRINGLVNFKVIKY